MRPAPNRRIVFMLLALAAPTIGSSGTMAASSMGFTTAPTDWTPHCRTVRVCAHWAPGAIGASGACNGWTTKRTCPGGMGN